VNRPFVLILLAMVITPVYAALRTVTLAVPTMDCPVCPFTVKKALTGAAGVRQVEVNLDKRVASVTFDDAKTSVESLTQVTREAGYPSTLAGAR